ncbi:ATP-binding protein [Agromyces cerinus]|uniref:histidine kinase n=1 Tax=Agromyces cerinus subsp. cerinus TaxID=232089 RepID=A0A1N6GAY8_9MICO|nr:histidine kinase [Agromyces cerinus]SIO04637.1 Histidine kinase [Agromyces cerinus subsp. cerinus]
MERGTPGPPLAQSLGSALTLLLAVGVLFAALEAVMLLPVDREYWVILLFPVVALVWFVAGTVAWRRRPGSRIGLIIWIGGIATLVAGLVNTDVPLAAVMGAIFATVTIAVTVHLLLAFPSGRLPDTRSRVIVVAAYLTATVLQMPTAVFTGGILVPFGVPMDAEPAAIGDSVQRIAAFALSVATAFVLVDRLRRASPARRRVLAPLYGYGVGSVLLIPTVALALGLLPLTVVVAIQLTLVAGIAVAFAVGVMIGSFERTAEAEELAAWLGTEEPGRAPLRAAIARALGDPTVDVVYWLPVRDGFVDDRGVTVDLPDRDGRAAVVIESAGQPVGAIIYDAQLLPEPSRVRAVGRVAAIAIARERLTTELRTSQTALRHSRVRLVEAADRERLRIAKDLHDGLQVQLVLLALEAGRIEGAAEDAAARSEAAQLRQGIEAAADALRRLVHDVMPAALVERGLVLAAEDLVDRMPIPTRLETSGLEAPLGSTVMNVAYFIVAEGLANTAKHARAASASVRLIRRADVLTIEVADDGIGGATDRHDRGLAGLGDRVDAIGGRMSLASPPGGGTLLTAELPCGS